MKLGRKTEAHATIEGALARAPQNADTHANLGTVIWWVPYLPWSSPQAAVDFYRQLLAIFIFAAVGSQFAAMWLSQVVVRR